MKKRIIPALCVVALLVLSLCGCGPKTFKMERQWQYRGYMDEGVFQSEPDKTIWIKFSVDGTGNFQIGDQSYDITWDQVTAPAGEKEAGTYHMVWRENDFTLSPTWKSGNTWQFILEADGNYLVFQTI